MGLASPHNIHVGWELDSKLVPVVPRDASRLKRRLKRQLRFVRLFPFVAAALACLPWLREVESFLPIRILGGILAALARILALAMFNTLREVSSVFDSCKWHFELMPFFGTESLRLMTFVFAASCFLITPWRRTIKSRLRRLSDVLLK